MILGYNKTYDKVVLPDSYQCWNTDMYQYYGHYLQYVGPKVYLFLATCNITVVDNFINM